MRIFENQILKLNSESGMTLLELILVMALIAILAGFISSFLYYEINVYKKLVNNTEGLQTSRNALQMISRDIRQIRAPESIFQASEDSIRFNDVNDFMISYKFSNSQILRNGDPLLNLVENAQFNYFDNSGNPLSSPVADPSEISTVTVSLRTSFNEHSFDLVTKVQPRNF